MPRAALAAAVGLWLLFAGLAGAADPPHWSSTTINIDCTSQCHVTHQAAGGGLTQAAGNVNLCQSCHMASGTAEGLVIANSDKAVPGASGTSHAFDVAAVNASLDTQTPQNSQMNLRVMGGNIVCSTCHDQHATDSARGGNPRVSPAKRTTALGSTGTVASGGTYTGAQGSWYLIEITSAGNESTAQFRYSKDNGLSWLGTRTAGTNVALDSGVTVSFAAGDFATGERWEFSASWPFLRAAIDSGDNASGAAFCRDCHRSWEMDHVAVHTYDGSYKSHPVGIALNANGGNYDRATPLDGNGAAQGSGGKDSNATNDLSLDGGGLVQCMTCHNPHYADSNTLTEDKP